MVLRLALFFLGLHWIASHIDYCDGACSQIFMPKMQLDEQMSLIRRRATDIVSGRFLEVYTVLLYLLKKEKELMGLDAPTIRCKLEFNVGFFLRGFRSRCRFVDHLTTTFTIIL